MIKAESLAANFLISSTERRRQATTIKRLVGGLRSFKKNGFELNANELRVLSDAISVLEQAAQVTKKAEKLLVKDEKRVQNR